MAGEREVESVNGEWSMVKSEMGSNRLLVDGGNACVFEVVVQGFVLSLFVLTQKVTQKVKRNPIAPRVFACQRHTLRSVI